MSRWPAAADSVSTVERVEAFCWSVGDAMVAWRTEQREVTKRYAAEIDSAVALRDGSGIAVVEPNVTADGLNAVVFDADGTERFRVVPPQPERHVCFQQMYYIGEELTAVAITSGSDWAAVVDPVTGLTIRTYETR